MDYIKDKGIVKKVIAGDNPGEVKHEEVDVENELAMLQLQLETAQRDLEYATEKISITEADIAKLQATIKIK